MNSKRLHKKEMIIERFPKTINIPDVKCIEDDVNKEHFVIYVKPVQGCTVMNSI